MTEPTSPDRDNRPRLGGGAAIALLTMAGVIIGGFMGQPTIGLLAGLGLGVVIAILVWRMGPR